MLNIYKLIEHLVHNLMPLNEYSQGILNKIIEKFKEEADDRNIEISDKLLTKYIDQFDRSKQSLPVDDRDIMTWSLQRLMKYASQSVSDEDEEWDPGLDEVYESEDGNITVWNGNNEDRCIRFAKDEAPWCIARGMFSSYHLSRDRGYPTFYLLRNRKLDEENYDQSFVALQVRDEEITGPDDNIVYTGRRNSPHESNSMSWEQFTSQVPWVTEEIPNAKEVLKYQPLSPADKTAIGGSKRYAAKVFAQLPLEQKKSYLSVKAQSNNFVDDMTNVQFIKKYIAPSTQLAKFVSINPNIFTSREKLQALEAFSKAEQNSIIANLQSYKMRQDQLWREEYPWLAKVLVTATRRWENANPSREFIYLTDNNKAIARFKVDNYSDEIRLGYATEHEEHPNIKINKNTGKYLVGLPLDLVPPALLLRLQGISPESDKYFATGLDTLATKKPDELKKIEKDGESIYYYVKKGEAVKVENGQITLLSDEEIDNLLSDEEKVGTTEEVKAVLQSALPGTQNLNTDLSQKKFTQVLNTIPYQDRPKSTGRHEGIPLVAAGPLDTPIIFVKNNFTTPKLTFRYGGYDDSNSGNWKNISGHGIMTVSMWKEYFKMLQETGQQPDGYSLRELSSLINSLAQDSSGDDAYKSFQNFVDSDPPLAEATKEKIILTKLDDGKPCVLDKQEPGESYKVNAIGRQTNVSQADYRSLMRQLAPETQPERPQRRQATVNPDGEPETAPDAFADWQPTTSGESIVDYVNRTVGIRFETLPPRVKERLEMGCRVIPLDNNERGQVTRNNLLGDRGQVTTTAKLAGQYSAMYVIELLSGQVIISVAIHPGNIYGIISDRGYIRLNSMNQFIDMLDRFGIREHYTQLVMNEYKVKKTNMKETKKSVGREQVTKLIRETVIELLNKK